jgi:hypothetical protein
MSTAASLSWRRRRPAARLISALLLAFAAGAGAGVAAPVRATGGVEQVVSSAVASDGTRYSVTNHLTPLARPGGDRAPRREWLLAWAGDAAQSTQTSGDPDFLAVIDATKGPSYGKVINTVTLDTVFGNEPHHMQYVWHQGDKVYAGAMFTDTTYVFDVSRLPVVTLSGVKPPSGTPCGSVPDAFQVLDDGTAYGTYLGGPDVSGPCRYTNGETRVGNGFAGTPGEIARIGPRGALLAEIPISAPEGEGPRCDSTPVLAVPSCANPHGIAVREDLNRMISSDLAEIRHTLAGQLPPDTIPARDTVRFFDISDRNDPELLSITHLPRGPRPAEDWFGWEQLAPMEVSVTNRPEHRGAFASTMGGAVLYTPDITKREPHWNEVFDDAAAFKSIFDDADLTSSVTDGGSWLQVSPDDRYIFHIVRSMGADIEKGEVTGMLFVLDVRRLLAARGNPRCDIDTVAEVLAGGAESDCPALAGAVRLDGGAHWGAIDNFQIGHGGYYTETTRISRVAASNYFLSATGFDGDHRVCLFDIAANGRPSLDRSFRDEQTRRPCLDFDRTRWPHGDRGPAKPHGLLFVVADADLR